jgi:hypothetical protein
MESAHPKLSGLAVSTTAIMEHEDASEEIGRLQSALGIGAGGLFQGGVLQGI